MTRSHLDAARRSAPALHLQRRRCLRVSAASRFHKPLALLMPLAYIDTQQDDTPQHGAKTMRTIDNGNNETLSQGISRNADDTFTALTFSQSKTFKTLNGARRWLAARGL